MRTCHDIIDLLSEYLDGGLPPEERREFEAHMGLCAACLEFLQSLRTTQTQVRALRCDDMPEDVYKALRSFLDRAAKGRKS